jgi:ribosomal protein L32E
VKLSPDFVQRSESSKHTRAAQEEFNKEQWGEDAQERLYWLHDLGGGRGLRLCREEPPIEAPATGSGKAKRVREDCAQGALETIATNIDEIAEVRKIVTGQNISASVSAISVSYKKHREYAPKRPRRVSLRAPA